MRWEPTIFATEPAPRDSRVRPTRAWGGSMGRENSKVTDSPRSFRGCGGSSPRGITESALQLWCAWGGPDRIAVFAIRPVPGAHRGVRGVVPPGDNCGVRGVAPPEEHRGADASVVRA